MLAVPRQDILEPNGDLRGVGRAAFALVVSGIEPLELHAVAEAPSEISYKKAISACKSGVPSGSRNGSIELAVSHFQCCVLDTTYI